MNFLSENSDFYFTGFHFYRYLMAFLCWEYIHDSCWESTTFCILKCSHKGEQEGLPYIDGSFRVYSVDFPWITYDQVFVPVVRFDTERFWVPFSRICCSCILEFNFASGLRDFSVNSPLWRPSVKKQLWLFFAITFSLNKFLPIFAKNMGIWWIRNYNDIYWLENGKQI